MTYEIVCTRGAMKGRRWAVTPQGLKIGRADGCEIQVGDVAAELYHCVVKLVGGKPVVANLASDNGVDVNGTSVDEAELCQNDIIRIGGESFIILSPDNRKTSVPKGAIAVILVGIAVIGAVVCRQKFGGVAKPNPSEVPVSTISEATEGKTSDDSVSTNRVVRLVSEEVVSTNSIVRIVDNIVITNYIVEVRRDGELVSTNVLPIASEHGKQDVEAAEKAVADVDEPSNAVPPYEVIDSMRALAMGGALGGDELRMVVNTNGTCDIIHIFTEEAKTKTFVVPKKNLIVPNSESFLVVGGGGAAGWGYHGSGGAGGVILKEAMALEPGTAFVYVGIGGSAYGETIGRNGEDSLLTIGGTTYTAIGGGAAGGCSGGSGGGGDKRTVWDGKGRALQPKSASGGVGCDGYWEGPYIYCGGGAALRSSISGRCEVYARGGLGYSLHAGPNTSLPDGCLMNGIRNRGHGVNGRHVVDARGSWHSSGSSGIVVIRYAVRQQSATDAFRPRMVHPSFPLPDKGVKSARIDGIVWRYFVEEDGTITIGCHGDGSLNHPDLWTPAVDTNVAWGALKIPNRIDGKPVKRIGKGAFQGCAKVKSFILPEGVTHCGPRAFARCPQLEAVVYPKSLEWLGEGQVYRSPEVKYLRFQSVPPKCDYGCCPLKGINTRVCIAVPFSFLREWRNWGEDGQDFCCNDGCHRHRVLSSPSAEEKREAKQTGAGFVGVEMEWKQFDNLEARQNWLRDRVDDVWRQAEGLSSERRALSLPKLYTPRDIMPKNTAIIYVSMMNFRAGESVSFSHWFDDGAMIMIDDKMVIDFSQRESKEPIWFGMTGWHRVAVIVANGGGYGGAVYSPQAGRRIGGVFYKRAKDEVWRMFEAKPDGSEFRVTKEDARRAVVEIEKARRKKK